MTGDLARERKLRMIEEEIRRLNARRDRITMQLADLERDIQAALAEQTRLRTYYGIPEPDRAAVASHAERKRRS